MNESQVKIDEIIEEATDALLSALRLKYGWDYWSDDSPITIYRPVAKDVKVAVKVSLENTKRTVTIASAAKEVPVYLMADKRYVTGVLEYLRTMANDYGSVSVVDYLDHIGAQSDSYWQHNYGWTPEDLEQATIVKIQRGWVIKFPPVNLLY